MFQLKRKNSDLAIGISLLIFSLFCYFVLVPKQVYINQNEISIIKADFFPKLWFGILALLSFMLCISSVSKNNNPEITAEKVKSNFLKVFFTISIIGVYILAIPYIGYFVSTTIVLICLMLNFGVKNPVKIVALSVITTTAVYFIFFRLMMIPLP
ncbi:tripartite tricarboxylate transporter TctB family protein [Lutispora sp.]|nr:tripartite tricarboxylate transporter TctB family protein [Lutispora sp.]MEA4963852.1 tripartite tricarboxylate transporter TctB family protein [Lutispora sp.]